MATYREKGGCETVIGCGVRCGPKGREGAVAAVSFGVNIQTVQQLGGIVMRVIWLQRQHLVGIGTSMIPESQAYSIYPDKDASCLDLWFLVFMWSNVLFLGGSMSQS